MDEKRPFISGVEVREADLEPQRGLRTMSWVFRGSAAVIFVLAIYQVVAWWLNPPPGGVGTGVLVGDTIRLIVFAALLWAAGNVGMLIIRMHYDVRAGRILLARQTHMMRQIGVAQGWLQDQLPSDDDDRRGTDA
jgi:hypothetical protein